MSFFAYGSERECVLSVMCIRGSKAELKFEKWFSENSKLNIFHDPKLDINVANIVFNWYTCGIVMILYIEKSDQRKFAETSTTNNAIGNHKQETGSWRIF